MNPQEIFLLERYTSVEYFGDLRDTWADLIRHVEDTLDTFVRKLPLDYRKRPRNEQPDVVWGEHILPNFRSTLQCLNTGFIKLSHGDLDGLNYVHGPLSDFKGQTEYSSLWMGLESEGKYGDLLNKATMMSANISRTESAEWHPYDLTTWYSEASFGPLDLPTLLPSYQLKLKERIVSGEKLRHSGIYLPDLAHSCAQYLSMAYTNAPEACVLIKGLDLIGHPIEKQFHELVEYEFSPCDWQLVERAPNPTRLAISKTVDPKNHRVIGGEACPESGYYFTPASSNSRKRFIRGEPMPVLGGEYGLSIWQWDTDQQ